VCTDMAAESAPSEQSEEGKVPGVTARPTGTTGVSPKHLAVDAQQLPNSSSSEDIENGSDEQVDLDINCGAHPITSGFPEQIVLTI